MFVCLVEGAPLNLPYQLAHSDNRWLCPNESLKLLHYLCRPRRTLVRPDALKAVGSAIPQYKATKRCVRKKEVSYSRIVATTSSMKSATK